MEENKETSLIAQASGLKTKDYIAYALGDVGCCLAFGLITTLLQTYYTDVLLLHPLFIMLMFVGARVWDAINDPIMGRIVDRMKPSKWGKYRPWFLYAGIPLAITAILVFIKWPTFGDKPSDIGVSIYATFTYILFGMVYTTIQIPYGSLASVVTLDDKERSKLSVFRSVGSTLGSMPVMVLSMLCFTQKTPENPTGVNYNVMLIGIIIMSVLSFVMLFIAFLGNKERVKTEAIVHEKGSLKKAVKRLFKSRAMVAVSIASLLLLAGQMFTQSYYNYIIRYYFNKGGIFVTLPTILTYVPMAILMVFTPKLVRKFGKKEICAVGMAVAALCNFLMFFLRFIPAETALWPFMGLCLISGFGFNFFVLQVWAMCTDAIDEVEVKNGTREDGTAYSFFMFFRKMGQVVAAIAVNGALLAMGYFESASDSFVFTSGQLGLMYDLATIIPAVLFGIMALIVFVWNPLSKSKVGELQILKRERLFLTATPVTTTRLQLSWLHPTLTSTFSVLQSLQATRLSTRPA